MPGQSVPFSLRIPEGLLLRLKGLARFNKRSANREAERILEEYISRWEKEHPERRLFPVADGVGEINGAVEAVVVDSAHPIPHHE